MWLRSDRIEVEVRPEKGADIVAFVDRASGIDVLFRSPWGRRDLAGAPVTGDSAVDWLARYGGGWQQLVPNAGAERTVDGVRRGYHGEAAVVTWSVEEAGEASARLRTDLITAPLRLTRVLALSGDTLRVRDTVENTGVAPVPVMWVQHPGFGGPFIDEHCTITAGARTIVTDAEYPGTGLAKDVRAPFPHAPGADLRRVPAPGSGETMFGCLTDFDGGWFAIDSPTAGFGIRMEWDTDLFPHAWWWQECNATHGFPWYRRAYVVAVEPANVLPGDPSPACPSRGETPLLDAGGTWTSDLTLSITR